MVTLPILRLSITKFSLFTNLRIIEVFVRIASVKASCAPRITVSFFGESTLLCLNPLASILKAVSIVSTKSRQFPIFTSDKISLNDCFFLTEF